MKRLFHIRLCGLPCVLYCVAAAATTLGGGCRVYDDSLLEQFASVSRFDSVAEANAVIDAAVSGETRTVVPGCGNGVVDERESCDIAILSGLQGACPEACDGSDGCFAQTLVGQRCGARCVPSEILAIASDDGCCPAGATPKTDNDCSGSCGNGMLEGAELCDPPGSCPTKESCKTAAKCSVAYYSGSSETCSARCQVLPITVCQSGDGCCPNGCDAQGDADCVRAAKPEMAASSGAEAGTGAPAEPAGACTSGEACSQEQKAEACAASHSGGRCHSCDCAHCATEVNACLTDATNPAGCARLAECAMENHCSGMQCLCGDDSVSFCQNLPRGPCMWEIRDVAGTRDFWGIFTAALSPGTPLGAALRLVDCRTQQCAAVCGL